MKSFGQYLQESLDKPYSSKFYDSDDDGYGNQTHEYHFKDHKGEHHPVYFRHNEESPHEAEMSFQSSEGGWKATGKQRHHAVRVFATMKHLIAQHAKKHPRLKAITFSSDKDETKPYEYKEGSRNKLYRRLANAAGGTTEDNDDRLLHRIPVNRDKK